MHPNINSPYPQVSNVHVHVHVCVHVCVHVHVGSIPCSSCGVNDYTVWCACCIGRMCLSLVYAEREEVLFAQVRLVPSLCPL